MGLIYLFYKFRSRNLHIEQVIEKYGSYKHIVLNHKEFSTTDPNKILFWASFAGHESLICSLLDMGCEVNHGLNGASAGGHIDLVHQMLILGAVSYDEARRYAYRHGHTMIVFLMESMGAKSFKRISDFV